MVVVRVRGTVRAPVDLRATVESLTGYHHRTTAEPWFTGRGQSGTRAFASSREPKIFVTVNYRNSVSVSSWINKYHPLGNSKRRSIKYKKEEYRGSSMISRRKRV